MDPPHRLIVVFYAKCPAFDRFSDIDGVVVVLPRRGISLGNDKGTREGMAYACSDDCA